MDAQTLTNELAHFTGSEQFYRYLFGVTLTEGAKHLAEKANAFWLMDIIASYQHEREFKKHADFQTWTLKLEAVGDGEQPSATVTATDGDGNVLAEQHIAMTDFPLNEITLWFEGGTILLPSEH
jgi:hypothetical protein